MRLIQIEASSKCRVALQLRRLRFLAVYQAMKLNDNDLER
jgi:hypothetical protein